MLGRNFRKTIILAILLVVLENVGKHPWFAKKKKNYK